jgi:hypothetical protein
MPDFTEMTNAEFAAFWDARIEAAAVAGDDDAVEAAMIEANEAFVARFAI